MPSNIFRALIKSKKQKIVKIIEKFPKEIATLKIDNFNSCKIRNLSKFTIMNKKIICKKIFKLAENSNLSSRNPIKKKIKQPKKIIIFNAVLSQFKATKLLFTKDNNMKKIKFKKIIRPPILEVLTL
jgi:hypothetical protein